MKGILLAGGKGTRLYPATFSVSKQLLPIFDKPMIYYPLSVFLEANIREVALISTLEELPRFQHLLGDGSRFGISLTYLEQTAPRGIADAFLVASHFIGSDPVALLLGDNIFYGPSLAPIVEEGRALQQGALILGYEVKDPRQYGVVVFDTEGNVLDIEEKPLHPRSCYAVPGLYFYDNTVKEKAARLTPSARGELEITDIHRLYLLEKKLSLRLFDRGNAWLDTGTFTALQQASSFVQAIQERQGVQIACLEEIAWRKGYIDADTLEASAQHYPKGNEYGDYLRRLLQ